MKTKKISFGAIAPLVALGVFTSTNSVKAADITGGGTIGISGSVTVFSFLDPTEGPSISFDFIPPVDGTLGGPGAADNVPATGDGRFAIGFESPAATAGGFEDFIPDITNVPPAFGTIGTGLISDLNVGTGGVLLDTLGGTPSSIPGFLVLQSNGDGAAGIDSGNDWSFTLESLQSAPDFQEVNGDLRITIQADGIWIDPNDATNIFDGEGIFTAQIESTNQAQFLNNLANGGSASFTYSADFVARQDIPEPTTMLGLAFASGLGVLSLKKKKKQVDFS